MFEIFIFLKKISQTSFWVLPYFSKYHISQVLRVLSMRNIPSWPSGRALFNWKVWITPLVKCLSYVKNKNVREKKIKKITHTKKILFLFRIARVFGQLIWKFQPDLTTFYFQLFFSFSPPNNSTNWCYLRLTSQPYWPPDKLKHVAGETDILAIETAEISRRQKKTKQSWGKYICPNHEIMTFLFFVLFSEFQKGDVLTPTYCRNVQSSQSVAVRMTHMSPHFFYDTWKPGGLGAPPARRLTS